MAYTIAEVNCVRFGYACLSTVIPACSPAKTVTVKRLESIPHVGARLSLCAGVARANLANTRRLIYHNAANNLLLYRITPQLVPLATHPLTAGWDWATELGEAFAAVGQAMREAGMRISSHPGHYTGLNSPHEEVVATAIKDLAYHARLHKLLNHGGVGRIVVHVGGGYGDKAAGIERFIGNLERVDPAVRRRLAVENDDTTYGTGDVLTLCQRAGLPMLFDLHHHMLNPAGTDLKQVLREIFATWPEGEPPKIHLSSPKSAAQPKAHADFVDAGMVREFLDLAGELGFQPGPIGAPGDFDFMVEAKMKDAAAMRLMAEVSQAMAVD